MKKAILGRKVGMTQIFGDKGESITVTVVEAGPCTVVQKKTRDTHGYDALQIGYLDNKEHKVGKPLLGQFQKVGLKPKKYLREVSLEDTAAYSIGQEIKADIFAPGDKIDVVAVSRGKGFAGSIKRHNQHRGPMSHGSRYHRGPGSLGGIMAARVFKGQTLPGRMGGARVTAQNLEVARVYPERNLILIKGAIPGPNKGLVTIKSAVKSKAKAKA
jgi:large subunit ribosomal protein L3